MANVVNGLISGEPKAFLQAVDAAISAYNQAFPQNGTSTPWLAHSANATITPPQSDSNFSSGHS